MRERLLSTPLLVILGVIAGLAMFIPAAHASIINAHRVAQSFLYSGLIVLTITGMIGLATANWRPRNVVRSQLASLVGAFIVFPLVFALPMSQALPDTSFVNAWFEMVSCFTTTGATVYDTPGRLAPSLHLWRALVGWMGGLFVLVTATAILTPMNLGGVEVLSGRSPGRGGDGLSQITKVADPSQRFLRYTLLLFPVYTALTLALWLLLMFAGEVNIVALIHAMGTISTSGIGMEGDLEVLQTGLVGEVLIFFFLMTAVSRRSFPGTTLVALQGPWYRDPEVRLAALLVSLVTMILVMRHWIGAIEVEGAADFGSILRAIWGAMFTALSFLTTTGYESGEWAATRAWSGLSSPGLILAGLAIIGGGVATTAGGVKLLRVYSLFRHGERELERLIHPSSIGGAGQQARRLRREGAYFAWLFFMLFALSISVIVGLLALLGLEFEPALVLTISALTTTGQLADLAAATTIRYVELGGAEKGVLAFAMVVGRLETLAILALLSPASWQR